MYRSDNRAHRASYVAVMGMQPFDAMLELCATHDTHEFLNQRSRCIGLIKICKQHNAAAMLPYHCSPRSGTLARAVKRSHWILPKTSFPFPPVLPHAPPTRSQTRDTNHQRQNIKSKMTTCEDHVIPAPVAR